MRKNAAPLLRLLVVATLAVALAAISFAHRLPGAEELQLQQYRLAASGIGALCGDPDGDRRLDSRSHCEACQISGGALLPDPVLQGRDGELVPVARVTAPRESQAVRRVLNPARLLRAPPLA